MTDRPIIFSGPMVRALLDGRKTQTRRVIKPQFPPQVDKAGFTVLHPPGFCAGRASSEPGSEWHRKLPYAIGDRLWVRETWGHDAPDLDACRRGVESDGMSYGPYYAADADWFDNKTVQMRPSIHMPRWASRLTLTVTGARVQRIQDISEADAIAEGCESEEFLDYDEWQRAVAPPGSKFHTIRDEFAKLWDRLNDARGFGWDANPWVVALTFTVERRNIDAEPKP